MKDIRLDVDLQISGNPEIRFDCHDPVASTLVSVDPCFMHVGLSVEHNLIPSDDECLPVDVSLYVSDLSGSYDAEDWRPLDASLVISGNSDIRFVVFDPVVADFVSVESRFIDVGVYTNYVPMPSDAECIPMDASLNVSDIAGKFGFMVDRDCHTALRLYSDPSVILDISCDLHWPGDMYPDYAGSYFIDPRKVDQVLPTKERSMEDNLQVNSIYFSKVVNESGGNTVLIGKE